jgi:two-component system NtrC family response regulator
MRDKLLLIEHDDAILSQIRWGLDSQYDIASANDRLAALAAFRTARPSVVLLDLSLPPFTEGTSEGPATLTELLAIDAATKVVLIVEPQEQSSARQAVGSGAYDWVEKPVNMDELKLLLDRCYYLARLERDYREIKLKIHRDSLEGMLGTCPPMQSVFEAIRKVATTDVPVMIVGESGSGKEMTARAIHHRSGRYKGPFVELNCSALPEMLINNELFGYEKGAFTGAFTQRRGRVEHANGGTLFLDDIGKLSPRAQEKLLRLLQQQVIEHVGSHQAIPVDIRLVTASSTDLRKDLSIGSIRKDLLYRIAIVQIDLPPLRERGEDVVVLANAFLRQSVRNGKHGLVFSDDALKAIRLHSWPGNVRELQNRVRRAVIMANGKEITGKDLELAIPDTTVTIGGGSLDVARSQVEREMLRNALRTSDGNISAAATALGVSRPTIYKLMSKLEISRMP